jgi:uncharacterized membrane protein YbaN (DUF454 family)
MPRLVYTFLGWLSVGLALVGAILPILPTTVFLILAAFLFGRGSPRARAWLVGHRLLGPPILRWEETGAIPWPAKLGASVAMLASLAISLFLGVPAWVLALQALCLAAAAAYVLTRPG